MSNQFMMPNNKSGNSNTYAHATKIKHVTLKIDPYKWKEPIKFNLGLIKGAEHLTADNFIVAYEIFGNSTDGTGGLSGEGTYSYDSSSLTLTYTPGNVGGGSYCNAPLWASLYYSYDKKRFSLGQKEVGNYGLTGSLGWNGSSLPNSLYTNSSDLVPTLSRFYMKSSESFMVYGFEVGVASNASTRVYFLNGSGYQNCSLAVSLMAFV